ncbi:MAG: lytic transglycosylase domain-containing protein, partial [Acidimicrobiales bacterium]
MKRLMVGVAGVGGAAGLVLLGLLTAVAGSTAWSQAQAVAPAAAADPGAPAGSIPPAYLAAFESAGQRFAVAWPVLAGIYKVECDFGRSLLAGCRPGTENGAGAQGPGQFLAPTWRRGLAAGQLIGPGPPSPSVADGYATDGDGDGVADPWNPADAAASTARLLAANGAATGDVAGAVFAYNHDAGYVQRVLALAAAYQGSAGSAGSGGNAAAATTVTGAPGGAETVVHA